MSNEYQSPKQHKKNVHVSDSKLDTLYPVTEAIMEFFCYLLLRYLSAKRVLHFAVQSVCESKWASVYQNIIVDKMCTRNMKKVILGMKVKKKGNFFQKDMMNSSHFLMHIIDTSGAKRISEMYKNTSISVHFYMKIYFLVSN